MQAPWPTGESSEREKSPGVECWAIKLPHRLLQLTKKKAELGAAPDPVVFNSLPWQRMPQPAVAPPAGHAGAHQPGHAALF